jgi:hypothetical protein
MKHPLLTASTTLAFAALALAGPDIDEVTSTQQDAGGTPKTAMVAKSGGSTSPIARASGSTSTSTALVGGDIVDMFIVRVSSVSAFSASTVGNADFDTMLFLCSITNDAAGQPSVARIITGNDNASSGTTGSTLTFPSPTTAYQAGTYAIVVTTARTMPYGLNFPASGAAVPPTVEPLLNYSATGLMTQTNFGPDLAVKLWQPVGGALGPGGNYGVALSGVTTLSVLGGGGYCGSIVAGSCFTEHPTLRGCDGYQCCQLICELDSACCSIGWDSTCAELALQNCPTCPETAPACPGDLNSDGAVDGSDLGLMLSAWGACS